LQGRWLPIGGARTVFSESPATLPAIPFCESERQARRNYRIRRLARIFPVRLLCRSAMPAALFAVLLAASAVQAQAPDAADVAEGMRLFRQKANCQACHGWAGDGRKMDSQMPDGANLRETKLDRQTLIMTIKCGRPGRGMPAFDKLA